MLEMYRPDGVIFRDLTDTEERLSNAQKKLSNAEAENQRLAAKLKELGLDPADL